MTTASPGVVDGNVLDGSGTRGAGLVALTTNRGEAPEIRAAAA